jgi:hypothetical protein
MNKDHCHILYKNTSCFDFFLPNFANFQNNLTIILWDNDNNIKNIKKNLPTQSFLKKINLKIDIYTVSDFFNLKICFIANLFFIFKLKKILYFFTKNFSILNTNKLIFFLRKFNNISIDGRDFDQIQQKEILFDCLNKTNKNIAIMPHAPHYRTSHSEKNFFCNLKKDKLENFTILIANKQSYQNANFLNSKYFPPPAISNSWINLLKKKKLLEINNSSFYKIGIILRPFRKKYSKTKLKKKKVDYYVSSYEENIEILKQCQNLVKNNCKIFLRLHPSTNRNEFYKIYKEYIIKNKIILTSNSIHEFLISCDAVISYPSTAIIYGYFYKKRVFLINNDLQKKIEKKWPYLNYLYSSIAIKINIRDIKNIKKIFFKKKHFKNKFKNFF